MYCLKSLSVRLALTEFLTLWELIQYLIYFQGRRHPPRPGGQGDPVQLQHGGGEHGQADAAQRDLRQHDGGSQQVSRTLPYECPNI